MVIALDTAPWWFAGHVAMGHQHQNLDRATHHDGALPWKHLPSVRM